MYLGATLRHPADARQHALWDQWREQEGYVGLWKKGEWYAMAPEKTVKLDMVRLSFPIAVELGIHLHLDQDRYISRRFLSRHPHPRSSRRIVSDRVAFLILPPVLAFLTLPQLSPSCSFIHHPLTTFIHIIEPYHPITLTLPLAFPP